MRVRIQKARWRLRAASLGGPEWDAATEHLAELEDQYKRLAARGRKRPAKE